MEHIMFVKWLKSPGAHMLLILPASSQAGRGNKAKNCFVPHMAPVFFLAQHGSWTKAEQTFATQGGRDSFPLK